ncbi:MAG: prolyl oligopeptidase family serine peptidase [Acidimicrobiia bacterium]
MPAAVSAQMVARGRMVGDPRWSPDGLWLAWSDSFDGRTDLVIEPADRSGPAVVATTDVALGRGASPFAWTSVGEIVYAAADGRLLAMAATGGPVRALSADGRAAAPAVSPDGTRVAFVLERDDACEIAVVATDGSAWPVRFSLGADWAIDPAWSADGRLLAWHEWDMPDMPWDASRIVIRPADGDRPGGPDRAVAGGDRVATGQPRFSPGGSTLAYVCDASGAAGVWVSQVDGGKAAPLLDDGCEQAEPTWGPGQRSYAWAPDGTAIALCRNERGFGRLVVASTSDGGPHRDLSKGWHHGLDWGTGGVACVRSGARTPPQVTVVDPDGNTQRRILAQGTPGALAAAGPAEPEPVSWEAGDGEVVHGLLYRPPTSPVGADAPPPLLVYVHGGPTGATAAGWWPRHQFWCGRGWAILAVNYRGSTGYGRAYTQALAGRWGVLDVDDVAAGIRHAGAAGWGDAGRVALDGGSAGAFTLLGICARHPGLVRAAVCRYGVTDLFELAETTHRYEARYLDHLVGPLPAAAERYRERSPINCLDAISTPLMVFQGDADKVVSKAQADALVDGLRRRGVPVEYHVYPGEGHGWSAPATVADELERSERFLRRWVLNCVGAPRPGAR